jgi:hypothetical protein
MAQKFCGLEHFMIKISQYQALSYLAHVHSSIISCVNIHGFTFSHEIHKRFFTIIIIIS